MNGRADWVAGFDSAPYSGMPRGSVYSRVPAEIDRGVSHVSVKMLIHGRRLLKVGFWEARLTWSFNT